jgi:hypothetical protein
MSKEYIINELQSALTNHIQPKTIRDNVTIKNGIIEYYQRANYRLFHTNARFQGPSDNKQISPKLALLLTILAIPPLSVCTPTPKL